ncbi:MAG: bifunctional diaminohydroxyphosphoribosylaminopyrimidine deaminase/5-amino-6-(5-phosphoribosylamino)uracil reductase RibD [Polyangiales bacterium]
MVDHEAMMRAAIAEAERARGGTGDNPWVGSVIVDEKGNIVARGHTQGPGEDHAEIGSLREARASGIELRTATLYSTLEPCSFHGRTPACAKVIAESGVARLVIGIRDPHPRVDGVGAEIVRAAGIDVIEGVCEREIRHQLAPWILRHHPHEPRRRAQSLLAGGSREAAILALCDLYAIDRETAEGLFD